MTLATASTLRLPTLPTSTRKNRTTLFRAIHAELIKFYTLLSNRIMLAVTVLFIPASATMLAISFASPSDNRPPGTSLTQVEPYMFVDSVLWVQMLFAVVIALFVTNEYASGQIKQSVLAVPARAVVVGAKAATAALLGFGIGFVGALASQSVPVAILSASEVRYHYQFMDAVLLAAKCGLYLAAVGIFVVGLAFLIRNTVVAIILPVLLLSILPEVIRSIPVDAIRTAVEFLPSIAGRLLISTFESGAGLTGWQGYAVLGGWALGTLIVAGIVTRARDA